MEAEAVQSVQNGEPVVNGATDGDASAAETAGEAPAKAAGDEQAAPTVPLTEGQEPQAAEQDEAKEGDGDENDTEEVKKLKQFGISNKVTTALGEVITSGVLKYEDLEEKTLELIKSLREEHGLFVIQQFREANLMGIQNVSAYLGSLVKNFKERLRQIGPQEAVTRPLITGPNLENMKKILEQSGYSLEVTIGQRKYGGPPPGWEGLPPGAGCEVYVGKIPRDVFEDELIPLFEQCGRIWDLRLMMDPVTGNNKGYAFVTYCEKGHAAEAAKKFEGHEIKPGKRLRVNVSVANTRLFVGNIPKSKGKEEISEELCKPAAVEGLSEIIVYANPDDPAKKKNRGFCFLEFSDHKSASQAKRKLSNGRIRPWNGELVIEWAEPQDEPDEETMNKVKILYVRPVKDSFTEEKIKEEFEKFGEVERVKKVKDYAFVHFTDRENAMKAMTALKGNELDGVVVEVSLAKPQSEKKRKDQNRPRQTGSNYSRSSGRNTNRYSGGSMGRKSGGGGSMGYGREAPPLMSRYSQRDRYFDQPAAFRRMSPWAEPFREDFRSAPMAMGNYGYNYGSAYGDDYYGGGGYGYGGRYNDYYDGYGSASAGGDMGLRGSRMYRGGSLMDPTRTMGYGQSPRGRMMGRGGRGQSFSQARPWDRSSGVAGSGQGSRIGSMKRKQPDGMATSAPKRGNGVASGIGTGSSFASMYGGPATGGVSGMNQGSSAWSYGVGVGAAVPQQQDWTSDTFTDNTFM